MEGTEENINLCQQFMEQFLATLVHTVIGFTSLIHCTRFVLVEAFLGGANNA